MNSQNCSRWTFVGIGVAIAAAAVFFSMLPDLKRYIKIESM